MPKLLFVNVDKYLDGSRAAGRSKRTLYINCDSVLPVNLFDFFLYQGHLRLVVRFFYKWKQSFLLEPFVYLITRGFVDRG